MDYRKLSISKQILLVAILLSAVLLVFLLSFSATQVLGNKNAIKEVVNRNRSFSVIEKIDRNFYERFGDVQAYAYNRLAIETVDSGRVTGLAQKFINTMVSYYVLYDLMMIIDIEGKVVAVNTVDKADVPVQTGFLIGRNYSNEEWFRLCTSAKGPEGGAWYSDFIENPDVAQIYNSKGRGVGFAAPIRNDHNRTIGVWYNFASWRDVTQGIRSETEDLLKKENARAFVLVTDKNGKVIDAADEGLTLNLQLPEDIINGNDVNFVLNGLSISSKDYIIGTAQGKGAYTYKGNNWKTFTFIPREEFSISLFTGELFTLVATTFLILAVGILAFLLLSRSISSRIRNLQQVIHSLSLGELVEGRVSRWRDEIGLMTGSLKLLTSGLMKTSVFANEIGKGNLDAEFEPLSAKDVLGTSLISMRHNLANIKANEERRSWITQGLAEFGERLRKNSSGTTQLCDDMIVFLCKYIEANQGAIFLKEEPVGSDKDFSPFLRLIACYAWKRKKYISLKVEESEGLIGQVWREGEMTYLTDVPHDFIRITSGLGEANPNNIVILPLKSNGDVLGVLEVASFKKIEKHEIEFLQKVSDTLASTLASEKINEKTKALLQRTQEQAEEMRSQEEEMRQNLEEMQTTQEAFKRREEEFMEQIKVLASNGRKHFSEKN